MKREQLVGPELLFRRQPALKIGTDEAWMMMMNIFILARDQQQIKQLERIKGILTVRVI